MTRKPMVFAAFVFLLAGGTILAESVMGAPPTPVSANPVLIYKNRAFGIEVSNADGTAKTELIAKSSLARPTWAPAGGTDYPRHVVYESPICRLKQFDLVLVDGKPVADDISDFPTPFEGYACAPDISPNGDRLVFGTGHYGDRSLLGTVKLDGSDPVRVYEAPLNSTITWASYSPKGTQIAFIESGPANPNGGPGVDFIKIINSDGTVGSDGNLTQTVYTASSSLRLVEWSPGTVANPAGTLAFSHNTSAGEAVYMLDLASPMAERLANGASPSWSADASQIFYVSTTGISVITLNPRKTTSLVKGGMSPKFRN